MSASSPVPMTLLDLLESHPPESTPCVVPEKDLRVSYAALREPVVACAEALSAAGVRQGDRIGIALPNGLPNAGRT